MRNRYFWRGVLAASVFWLVFFFPLAWNTWQTVTVAEDALHASGENFRKVQARWEQCSAQRKALEQPILLYEFQPDPGVEVAGGLLTIGPGRALGRWGQSSPRWFVAGSQTVEVIGDGSGTGISRWDAARREWRQPEPATNFR